MSFPKYPEYKDSGVEWLGEVPAHWDVTPVRAFVEEQTAKNASGDEENYLSLMANVGVIPYEEKGDVGNKKPDDLSKCKKVDIGDLVINSMNYGIGSYGLSGLKGVCSPVYIVLRPMEEKVLPRYALRIFENKEFQKLAQSFGQGILAHRSAIGWDDLKNIKVPMPGTAEQAQLSAFLDHETARIDALVEEQQRLIELLKEKRQAVISHAVTKGLDPDVPMKDSGVEWLREVPAHWDTPRLKHVADAQGGSTPSKEREDYWLGDIPWVSPKDMKRDVITKTIDNVSEEAVGDSGLKIIPCRSVLVVVRGMILAHTFPVALSGVEVTINQDMKAIIPACDRLLPEYLLLLLRGIDEVIFDCIDSSAHGTKKLQWEEFFNTQVPLPSLDEQLRISSEVQAELDQLEQLTSQAQLMARTLSERRSALISAAVTGKIDVRGWQPPAGSPAPETTQAEAL